MSNITDMETDEHVDVFPLGDTLHAHEDHETERSVRRFIWAMWISVFILLVLNSGQLVTYVNGFDVGPVQDAVVSFSNGWDEKMQALGASEPSAYLREQVAKLHDMSWEQIMDEAEKRKARETAENFLRGMLNDNLGEAQNVLPGRS